jgi:hypothetical protein
LIAAKSGDTLSAQTLPPHFAELTLGLAEGKTRGRNAGYGQQRGQSR